MESWYAVFGNLVWTIKQACEEAGVYSLDVCCGKADSIGQDWTMMKRNELQGLNTSFPWIIKDQMARFAIMTSNKKI
jgi:hypothetical protein